MLIHGELVGVAIRSGTVRGAGAVGGIVLVEPDVLLDEVDLLESILFPGL